MEELILIRRDPEWNPNTSWGAALLGAPTRGKFTQLTTDLLNYLGMAGYWVSQKKAQIAQQELWYLGFCSEDL